MRFAATATFMVFLISVSGCATVTRGTKDVLEIKTTPGGAQATTSNGFACATPCALKMPRRSEFDVDLSKAGYKPARVHVTSKVSGQGGAGMAGNVLVGGIIGAGVDIGTGAMLDLVPNPVEVVLEPAHGAIPAATVATADPIEPTQARTATSASAIAPASADSSSSTSSLPPLPTQTKRLPGHRLAAYGCPGFSPRVLYSESVEKLPKNCERIVPL